MGINAVRVKNIMAITLALCLITLSACDWTGRSRDRVNRVSAIFGVKSSIATIFESPPAFGSDSLEAYDFQLETRVNITELQELDSEYNQAMNNHFGSVLNSYDESEGVSEKQKEAILSYSTYLEALPETKYLFNHDAEDGIVELVVYNSMLNKGLYWYIKI